MDGSAVAGGGPWRLAGRARAGRAWAGRAWAGGSLAAGCAEISTGAVVPSCARAVLPVETAEIADPAGHCTLQRGTAEEAAFRALGLWAGAWLTEAAASGTGRIRHKMAEAVDLAKLHGQAETDRALGTAAIAERFAENDLIAILTHQAVSAGHDPVRASEAHSLQPGPRTYARSAGWTTEA